MEHRHASNQYKWYILALTSLTNTLVAALPVMCMPVLFKEISADMGLSLVQIGVIWGFFSLPGIVMSLVGGLIIDRLPPKRVIAFACVFIGAAGALRGFAWDYNSLLISIVLMGLLYSFVTMTNLKICRMWFPPQQMGLASGLNSMGMALGFIIGSLISATVLSPWLGGWRQVMFFLGAVTASVCLPWLFVKDPPQASTGAPADAKSRSFMTNLREVARLKQVWLLAFIILCINGCIQGVLGYLPMYLTNAGWVNGTADWAQTSFHLTSMLLVIPIALLSDRLKKREWVLMWTVAQIALGTCLLSFAQGPLIWIAIITVGMVRDGFMGVYMTSILEADGVDLALSGTALGLCMTFSNAGGIISPALGNSLSSFTPSTPFIFWGALAVIALVVLVVLVKTRQPVQAGAVE